MGDLKDPRLMYLKAALLLVAGVMAGAGILVEHPSWRTAFLLAVAVICFCRLYYFAFYVIEKYIDDSFRFAGLWSVVVYLFRRPKPGVSAGAGEDDRTPSPSGRGQG